MSRRLTLPTEPLFVDLHVRSVLTAVVMFCLGVTGSGQEQHRASLDERTEIQLISEPHRILSKPRAELFLRLPDHITFREGSSVELEIEISPGVLSHVLGLRIAMNQESLTFERSASGASEQVRAPIPARLLQPGWNQLAIELVHSNTIPAARALTERGAWTLKGTNTVLHLAYKRMKAFPELGRFPHSYVEEKLLRATETNLVEVFVPQHRRNAYARALAVVGARLGQIDYVRASDVRTRPITDWRADNTGPNAIIVGIVGDSAIQGVPLHIQSRLRRLQSGEGLIAEWIAGNRRRCLLVTATDESGLENAVLTLGSSPALIWAPPSPVVVNSPPELREDLTFLARPHKGSLTFDSLGWSPLFLRGTAREQNLSGWRLPPGFALTEDSRLELNFISGPGLTSSSVEMLVNGISVGEIKLTPEYASLTSARIALPVGLKGHDPMTLTFRTRLFSSSNTVPWISVLGTSRLIVNPKVCDPTTLAGIRGILFSNPFLKNLAFGLPEKSSWEEMNFFLSQMLLLGQRVPSAAIVQPDALYFSETRALVPERVHNRHVIVFGSAAQWTEALPPYASLSISLRGPDTVLTQGRGRKLDQFDSELGWVQLLRSPWDDAMNTIVLGGWKSLAVDSLDGVLMESDDKLFGNVSAIDSQGRTAAYDTRRGNNVSLAEHIQNRLPAGLNKEETLTRVEARQTITKESIRINRVVWIIAPTLLCVFVIARVWLMWDDTQRRKRALEGEKPLVV